ncbi:MAG: HAD family phosphatase [Ruminococcus sp.]|nr:HAD family phosphatase [Ruminococcus sp.]
MIKNIVFDVGKVLVSYDPDTYMEKILGYDETTRQAVNAAMFQNPLWEESDRGALSTEELVEGFVKNNPAYKEQIVRAHRQVGDSIELFPYVIDWMADLKERGYRLYILSNYAEYTYQQTEDKMAFLPFMDGAVFSYECKYIKPEKEIYAYLCEKYHLNPDECVFLDDRQSNIDGAVQAGMKGILFENYEQATDALHVLLG